MIKSFNSNKKEILLKGVEVFFIRVLGYGFGFLFTWFLANKYGARIQGIFALSFMFLSIGNMVAKLGVETSIVKWIAREDNLGKKKSIYLSSLKVVLVSSVLVGLILFYLSDLIALMYDKPSVVLSVKYAAITIPFFTILDFSANYFRGEKQTTIFATYFHFLKFFIPFLLLILSYNFFGIIEESPIKSYSISMSLLAVVVVIHILYRFKSISFSKKNMLKPRFIINHSYPMMISSAIVLLMGWSDVFILGFYVDEAVIGIYSTAVKIATIVAFIYNAITTITTPKIAEYFSRNNINKLEETIHFSTKAIFVLSLPVFFILFFFSGELLSFFGEEYLVGKNVLRILLVAQFTNVLTGPVGPMFQMTGKQNKLQKIILIALFINIALNLLLVQTYHIIGVAIASALGMIFWNIIGAGYISKVMNIRTWITLKVLK